MFPSQAWLTANRILFPSARTGFITSPPAREIAPLFSSTAGRAISVSGANRFRCWRTRRGSFSLILPGHGQSDKPQTNYTMDFFAEAVLAVLRDASVDKAIFIGHSMGAAVLCRVHHHAPEKFAGLVSVDGLLCRLAGTRGGGRGIGRAASPRRTIWNTPKDSSALFFPFPAPKRCATA